MTMGIVLVASLAAKLAGVPDATMRSTLRATSSAASPGSRSSSPSVKRYSMRRFWPRRSRTPQPLRVTLDQAAPGLSRGRPQKPDPGTFAACCRAKTAPTPRQKAKPAPPAPPTNARRLRRPPRRSIGGPLPGRHHPIGTGQCQGEHHRMARPQVSAKAGASPFAVWRKIRASVQSSATSTADDSTTGVELRSRASLHPALSG